MSAKINIQETVRDGSIRSINYFTGRLLTASDLSREKLATRESDWRLGRALGEGVAYGLEVSIAEKGAPPTQVGEVQKTPALHIEPGLAINRAGQTLALRDAIDLQLVKPTVPATAGASIFGQCNPIQSGVYVAGKGVYLLTMLPAEGREGRAPATGLGNATAPCNTDTILEAVQFRHIHITSFFDDGELKEPDLLRNRVAYRCFGVQEMNDFVTNPFDPSPLRYRLIDQLRDEKAISNCDVPLAIFYWTDSGGIEFVDLWAVRRRLTKRATSQDLSPLADDLRLTEGEAMFFQFQEQLEVLRASQASVQSLIATRYFRYLPPIGFLILTDGSANNSFDYQRFFNDVTHREPLFIEGAKVESLIHQAMGFKPINLTTSEMLWLYYVRENMKAVNNRTSDQPQSYMIFTNGHIPFQGRAHYDLARWGYSNYF